MNSESQDNFGRFRDYILFSFQMPDLKLEGMTALLVARLFQESIDRALESEGLLSDVTQPDVWAAQRKSLETGSNMVAVQMRRIESDPALPADQKEKLLAPFRQSRDDSTRLFQGRPITMIPGGDRMYSSVLVTDVARGLIVIAAELRRLAFLERSKIGHFDAQDGVWRAYFPKNSNQSFDEHALVILKVFGLIKQ